MPLQLVPKRVVKRNALVEEHLGLVDLIARNLMKRLPPSFECDDLASEGRLGLIDAADKFEPARGVPFRAFAAMKIRCHILESVRRRHWKNATTMPLTAEVLDVQTDTACAETVVRSIEHGQRARIVSEAVAALPPKERKVIEIYFGGDGQLSGIGAEFGVRQSRSSQLLKQAKKRVAEEIGFRGLKAA